MRLGYRSLGQLEQTLSGFSVWRLLEVTTLTSFTVSVDSRALNGDGTVQFAAAIGRRVAATDDFVSSLSLFYFPGDRSCSDLLGITDAGTLERVLTALTTVAPPSLVSFYFDATTSKEPELTAAFRAFFAHQCELREVGVSQSWLAFDRTLAPVTDSFFHGLLRAGPHLDTITLVRMPSRYGILSNFVNVAYSLSSLCNRPLVHELLCICCEKRLRGTHRTWLKRFLLCSAHIPDTHLLPLPLRSRLSLLLLRSLLMAHPGLKKLTWTLPEYDFGYQRLRYSADQITDQWIALFALTPQCPSLKIRIEGAHGGYYNYDGSV